MAAIIALNQALFENDFTIYTDSEYVRIGFKKIINNKRTQKIGAKNDDLWLIADSIIEERQQKDQITKVEHVNSHLLDKNAIEKVKNFENKWNDMCYKFKEDVIRILKGNLKADRMAKEMQKDNVNCLGMQVNDTAMKWVIADKDMFWNSIPDFFDWWKSKYKKIYRSKYISEFKWSDDKYDRISTKRLYSSLQ
jgi:ribonuclease HI